MPISRSELVSMMRSSLSQTLAATLVALLALSCTKSQPDLYFPSTAIHFEASGALTQEVILNTNQAWTLSCEESWVKLNPASGAKDAAFTVSVEENISLRSRSALVTAQGGGLQAQLSISQDGATPSRKTDSLALVSIYQAAHGDKWAAEIAWQLNKPIDQWPGVVLLGDRVNALNIPPLTEAWTLPAALGDLTEISSLSLSSASVEGPIPNQIYNLSKLETLYLNENHFTGSISPKIAQLTHLHVFSADYNEEISGDLPKEIGQLKELQALMLNHTGVSGMLPEEWIGCSYLQTLEISNTQLSGIPDNFNHWTSLRILRLSGNAGLTGPLPASIGLCQYIRILALKDCNFTGNIPKSYANLPDGCVSLTLSGNRLKGTVPSGVKAHTNWSRWNPKTNILPQQDGFGLSE